MTHEEKKFAMTAKTVFALEPVLANELAAIGAEEINVLNRAVSFTGTKETMYRANLELRTALRILKPIHSFTVRDETELYNETKRFAWDAFLTPRTTFAIDSFVHSEKFNHANYVALKVKDAIVDQLRTVYGLRPDVDIENPDVRINVHISDEQCTISLDSSGNSLHKRGYRIGQGLAPINEVLAAGMILLTGWNGQSNFVDPMCGSGTFLMEAATIAYNIAPGMKIGGFGFMRWNDWDEKLWKKIVDGAKSREREFTHAILGFDESPEAIAIAKDNIKNAELGWKILVKPSKLQDLTPDMLPDGGLVMINPPYGERLNSTDADHLYEEIGDALKRNFNGFSAWIISSNKEALKHIGLKTSRKLLLYNGSLECKFHNYQIYSGSKKMKYQQTRDGAAEDGGGDTR
jgi:putative N6-adenine-specific DNA methylase